jgi:hypothetical protein
MATADAAVPMSKYSVQRTLVKLAPISAVVTTITSLPLILQGAIYDVGTGLLTFIDQSDVEPAIETLSTPTPAVTPAAPPIVAPVPFDYLHLQMPTNKARGPNQKLAVDDLTGDLVLAGQSSGNTN